MIKQIKQRARNMRVVSQLMTTSEQYANAMGEQEAGAEHLVLAAFDLPDGTARKAFEQAGGDPEAYMGAIDKQYRDALTTAGIQTPKNNSDDLIEKKFFPRAKPSFTNVVRDMAKHSNFWKAKPLVGAAVIASVARQERGVAIRALRTLEIDPHRLLHSAEECLL